MNYYRVSNSQSYSKCTKCTNGFTHRSSPWTECDPRNLVFQLRTTGLKQVQILGAVTASTSTSTKPCQRQQLGMSLSNVGNMHNMGMDGWERCSACRRMSKRLSDPITPILEETD